MEKDAKHTDILSVLFDEDNCDPIELVDDHSGKKIPFEQIAVIPYDEKIYCILKPIDEISGIKDDEAVVFFVEFDEDDNSFLVVEEDKEKAEAVFEKYIEAKREEQ